METDFFSSAIQVRSHNSFHEACKGDVNLRRSYFLQFSSYYIKREPFAPKKKITVVTLPRVANDCSDALPPTVGISPKTGGQK